MYIIINRASTQLVTLYIYIYIYIIQYSNDIQYTQIYNYL